MTVWTDLAFCCLITIMTATGGFVFAKFGQTASKQPLSTSVQFLGITAVQLVSMPQPALELPLVAKVETLKL